MMRSLVAHAWAAPATLVGLVLLVAARAGGARVRAVDGTLEVAGGRVGAAAARLPRTLRFNAITFGHVILGLDEDALHWCRAHERVHVRQYERWGIFFFPLYLGSSLVQWARGRRPYWDNHFEREAYRSAPAQREATPN
jgi:hypothetical protein